MTPIQSQALDLLAWLFIWSVRIVGFFLLIGLGVGFFAIMSGFLAGMNAP